MPRLASSRLVCRVPEETKKPASPGSPVPTPNRAQIRVLRFGPLWMRCRWPLGEALQVAAALTYGTNTKKAIKHQTSNLKVQRQSQTKLFQIVIEEVSSVNRKEHSMHLHAKLYGNRHTSDRTHRTAPPSDPHPNTSNWARV